MSVMIPFKTTDEVEAVAYPGQTEDVRVGLGVTAWVKYTWREHPVSESLTSKDRPYPEATHTPGQFIQKFPPRAGGAVEREAIELGLL